MFMIDPMSRQPVYEQIIRQMERFILSGCWRPGDSCHAYAACPWSCPSIPTPSRRPIRSWMCAALSIPCPARGCYVSENAAALLGEYKRTQLHTLSQLTQELAMAGIPQEDVARCVEDAYRQAKNERVERA